MQDDLIDHLICPDCKKKLATDTSKSLSCPRCNRIFELDGNVISMLPSQIEYNFEDEAWKTLPYEGADKPAWMALLHKKDRVLYFYEKILSEVSFKGKVLEIGSGTCWASALIKKKHPRSFVVSTDISPFALEKGVSVAHLLESTVDYCIACDAESLPFADEYFDVILSNATIHHFLNPQKGINEMYRTLKKGGICIALGEVAAGSPFKTILTSRIGPAGKRARALEIEEKTYSLSEWKHFFQTSGFNNIRIVIDKTWQHKLYSWFTALYYRILTNIPDFFIGNFLPSNIDIHASKP